MAIVQREAYSTAGDGTHSALVGRGEELARFSAALERARAGHGSAAVVWGRAGVGKTRLLEEFSRAAVAVGATICGAACSEYARAPFGPFIDALRGIGLSELLGTDDSPAKSRAAAEAARRQRFTRVADALREAAKGAPIVIWIDDAQWADVASIELFAFLARALADARIVALAAVRIDDIERDPVRFEMLGKLRTPDVASADLRPLRDAEIRQLAESLWPHDGPPLDERIERICALAEGRPYFAEELVRSALAHIETGADEMPLGIRTGVLARLGRMSADARRALDVASVVGMRFDDALIAAVIERPVERVRTWLDGAREALVVREDADVPGAYSFAHAITREVIYRELPPSAARALHRAVAERLDARSDADPSTVAFHWSEAGDAVNAALAGERAGDAALARSAYEDAAIAFRTAIEALPPGDPSYALLCERLSRAVSIAGDIDEAILWCRRAIDAYLDTGEGAHALALAMRLARRTYENGRPERALELAERALGALGDDGDVDLRHDAHVSLASFHALQGRSAEATAEIDQAAEISGERPLEQRHYFHLIRGMVRAAHHGLAAAFADYEEALRLAREIGDDERTIWTLNNYASRATVAGRTAAAVTALREAVDISERRNFAKVASFSGQGLALAHVFAGDLANAQHWHERASEKSGPVLALAIGTSVALRLAYLRGDDAAAEPYATAELRETAFRSGESQNIGLLAGCAAAYLDATGRRADARELRRRALSELRTADFSFWLLDQIAANDDGEHLQRARALLEDAARDPDHEAAHAYLALFDARTMLREGKRPDARIAAREAAQRFGRLGWPWEHAQALEIAGERGVAQQMYTRHGCSRDAERVANARRRVRHRPSSRHLTQRELEVARLAADGHGNRAIAEQLHIGERTVETHIAAIFDRFDLTSRTQLRPLLERTAAAQAQGLQE